MAAAIFALKEQVATPITIPVGWDVAGFPGGGGGSGGGGVVRFTGDNLLEAALDFERRNPGDLGRAASALNVTEAQLREAGVPGFATGTPGLDFVDFKGGTPVVLHGREAVVPEQMAQAFAAKHGAGSGQVHVHVNIDGREAARAIVPHMPRFLEQMGLA